MDMDGKGHFCAISAGDPVEGAAVLAKGYVDAKIAKVVIGFQFIVHSF